MLKKNEIIEVLIDHGVSLIESERLLDDKETFDLAIKDIEEKTLSSFSTVELSHRAINEEIDKWEKYQDVPYNDNFGVPKIIIGKRQINDLKKRLKDRKG